MDTELPRTVSGEVIAFHETILKRVNYATREAVAMFVGARELDSELPQVTLFGPMCGLKTTTLARITEGLEENGMGMHVFKCTFDQRGGTGAGQAFVRGRSPLPATAIRGIDEVADEVSKGKIQPGEGIGLIEAQFMGDSRQLSELQSLLRHRNIGLVSDALGGWFNLEPVPQVHTLLSGSTRGYYMQGYDIFSGKPSQATMRGVGITPDGEVVHADGQYLQSLPTAERIRIARRLARHPVYGRSLTINPESRPDIGLCTLVPSHAEDPLQAIGSDRYFPVSLDTYADLYNLAGMPIPEKISLAVNQHFPYGCVLDWNSVNLAS